MSDKKQNNAEMRHIHAVTEIREKWKEHVWEIQVTKLDV
jgi:hypothetical protein